MYIHRPSRLASGTYQVHPLHKIMPDAFQVSHCVAKDLLDELRHEAQPFHHWMPDRLCRAVRQTPKGVSWRRAGPAQRSGRQPAGPAEAVFLVEDRGGDVLAPLDLEAMIERLGIARAVSLRWFGCAFVRISP